MGRDIFSTLFLFAAITEIKMYAIIAFVDGCLRLFAEGNLILR